MKSGGLVNTLVIVSQLRALWDLGKYHYPETIALLEHAAKAFDTDGEDTALEGIYREMPSWNLSTDLLGRSAASLAVIELDGVHWSDRGKAERILDTLGRAGNPLPYRREQWFDRAPTFSTRARNGENSSRFI